MKKKVLTDIDYVELYAKKLKYHKDIFNQQLVLINSQIEASHSLFKNAFGEGEDFKKNAREYLKRVGVLK